MDGEIQLALVVVEEMESVRSKMERVSDEALIDELERSEGREGPSTRALARLASICLSDRGAR